MHTRHILVVDDERSMREMLELLLMDEGYRVSVAESGRAGLKIMEAAGFIDLVITDIRMPDMDGLALLKQIKGINSEIPVIMMTAFATTETAVDALKEGAADYIIKPFQMDEMKVIVRRALERRQLLEENISLKKELQAKSRFDLLIGSSERMQQVFNTIRKVADLSSTVLITGPSGTGKELVASAIHNQGSRRENPFVAINCGALPESLLESELFGHERGSFTGAVDTKRGLLETADSGTVFLDEIAETSLAIQVKLLRFLNDKRFKRVGGIRDISVDVRIISATNQDLEAAVRDGKFRQDLFYRLNVIPIQMPALKDRREDIPLLVDHFVRRSCEQCGRDPIEVTQGAVELLMVYDWPGNVRELENVIERTVALEAKQRLLPEHLPAHIRFSTRRKPLPTPDFSDGIVDLDKILDEVERDHLIAALQRTGGVKKEAARLLNISFRSIRYRLQKHGMDHDGD